MKTVRFAELVKTAGKPAPHQLWSAPAQDPGFRRALKEHRVLTIHQENVGTRKDFGVAGFHEEPHAQFVIFPKSIREFEGRRVIGINYDLLAQPAITFAGAMASEQGKRPAKPGPRDSGREKTAVAGKPARTEKETWPSDARTVGAHLGAPSAAETASTPAKTQKTVGSSHRTKLPTGKVEPASSADEVHAEPITRSKSAPSLDPRVAREITRAMKELKAGKAVAAYERLQRLLATHDKG